MSGLVSYAETSSDDEDRSSPECGSNNVVETECHFANHGCTTSVVNLASHDPSKEKQIIDFPITDESDDQGGDLVGSGNEQHSNQSSSRHVSNLALTSRAHLQETETSQNDECNHSHVHSGFGEGEFPQTVHFQNKVTDDITHTPVQKNIHIQAVSSDKLQKHTSQISISKDKSVVPHEADDDKMCDVPAQSHLSMKGNHSFIEAVPRSLPVLQSESTSCSLGNRKRKLSNDRDKQLNVPDSIQSMYSDRQRRWADSPEQHDNRIRSFPHLEGNWATHVFISVTKNEPFVRFVDNLLKLLMPPTFQVQQDFHVSLSRTVAIRYHWIEPLVDSLRENFKCLKSCISDLTAVKLFTNDEKTRTFVSIELSQDDKEFLDYVKAVDKSFAEFKLPAYYENPSFHISVGWCLGDAVEKISDEKLSKAQEMLGDFMAANPDLSFIFAHQICCQSGSKSFVITLQDSAM